MYERSAIVLEKYFQELFGFNKKNNLQVNYEKYENVIKEIKSYQKIVEKEEKIIQEFDIIAGKIQRIQKSQETLCQENIDLEEERIQLFNSLDLDARTLGKKLDRIESIQDKNIEELRKLKTDFIECFYEFTEKQKERNKCSKNRRVVEANHIALLKEASQLVRDIDGEYIKNLKEFIDSEETSIETELTRVMINNGREEKVGFNTGVIKNAVSVRIDIAKREAETYLVAFERQKRLLIELNSDNLKLAKYEKALRDISVKLAFLESEKEYIVGFLDNERMSALNGPKVHKELMKDACKCFESDIIQIDNLYELITREIAGKAVKKAYKELYNKTYLRIIEEKEKNFEEEANNIKINIGTIINANYWRIEGVKNIYDVFQKEITEKFEKDLSGYRLDEEEELERENKLQKIGEIEIEESNELPKALRKGIFSNELDEDEDEDEEDENIDDYDDDEDTDDEEYEDDEYEEDDDEEYDDDEYEDDDEDDNEDYDEDDDEDYDDEDELDDEDEEVAKQEEKVKAKDDDKKKDKKKKNVKGKRLKEKESKGLFDKLFK